MALLRSWNDNQGDLDEIRNEFWDAENTYLCPHKCIRCKQYKDFPFSSKSRECPHTDEEMTCLECVGDTQNCVPDCPTRKDWDAQCLEGCK